MSRQFSQIWSSKKLGMRPITVLAHDLGGLNTIVNGILLPKIDTMVPDDAAHAVKLGEGHEDWLPVFDSQAEANVALSVIPRRLGPRKVNGLLGFVFMPKRNSIYMFGNCFGPMRYNDGMGYLGTFNMTTETLCQAVMNISDSDIKHVHGVCKFNRFFPAFETKSAAAGTGNSSGEPVWGTVGGTTKYAYQQVKRELEKTYGHKLSSIDQFENM